MLEFTQKKKVCEQTYKEWIHDYDKGSLREDNGVKHIQNQASVKASSTFLYQGHRTTCRGSVVLIFTSIDHKTEVIKFFNVGLEGRNKKYPAGRHGQFNPPKNGNFRKFWMVSVGKEPKRWCRVHKSMRSALKDLSFTGEIINAIDSKGNLYFKFTELSIID